MTKANRAPEPFDKIVEKYNLVPIKYGADEVYEKDAFIFAQISAAIHETPVSWATEHFKSQDTFPLLDLLDAPGKCPEWATHIVWYRK